MGIKSGSYEPETARQRFKTQNYLRILVIGLLCGAPAFLFLYLAFTSEEGGNMFFTLVGIGLIFIAIFGIKFRLDVGRQTDIELQAEALVHPSKRRTKAQLEAQYRQGLERLESKYGNYVMCDENRLPSL